MTVRLRKGTFKHIESELTAYQETLREITRIRSHIIDSGYGGDDPTSRAAIMMASHKQLEEMERITRAISDIYNSLPEKRQQLIRLKYWKRPQTLTWEGIAQQLEVTSRHAMRWKNEIIQAIGQKLGWR